MNLMLFPTFVLALLLFAAGAVTARRAGALAFGILLGFGLGLAMPGILFAVYYLKILGEPIWLYEFRSHPMSELAAGGAGLLAGLLHARFGSNERFRRIAGRRFFPGVLALGLMLPYLKPILRPPDWKQFHDKWSDEICLQTSESSCGPACAATLLRHFGKAASEEEMARASFTSRNGTENWYLARALRERGLHVRFIYDSALTNGFPYPAIAGVRLAESGNTGHFIVILDRIGDKFVVADPLIGKQVQSSVELQSAYDFTGFFLVVN